MSATEFPSWWRDDSNLIVIDIGIDESQSRPNPLLVVSAIVGNTAVMRNLDKEWKRELVSSGVDYFHATEHWSGSSKPYHGISRAERDKLLNQLVRHTQHRVLFGVSSFVDEAEYKSYAERTIQKPIWFAVRIRVPDPHGDNLHEAS